MAAYHALYVLCLCVCISSCHLIHVSTDWVYDGNLALSTESSGEQEGFGAYGKSKRAGEKHIESTPGLSYTILRSALIYGPPSPYSSKHSFIQFMLTAMSNNELLELFSDEYRTPVYVNDILRVITMLLARIANKGEDKDIQGSLHTNQQGNVGHWSRWMQCEWIDV